MKVEINGRKIGLVLSGGGAKGAYQVGMFKALEEYGLSENITAMSGCSIGAYAEVIYALRGYHAYMDFLLDFEKMMNSGRVLQDSVVEQAQKDVQDGKVSKQQFISESRFWKYEPVELYGYFRDIVSNDAIRKSGIPMSVCDYSIEEDRPVYFKLNDLTEEEQVNAIIGSGSLQFLFPPCEVKGHHCLDGGAVPDICEYPAAKDKIPLKPIVNEDVDVVFINFLIAIDYVDLSMIPRTKKFVELRPSRLLEDYPGSGTLDFTPDKLRQHADLGYKDTVHLIQKNFSF